MIVIGIDPGTASTGYGVIENSKSKFKYLDCGVIRTSPDLAAPQRLLQINKELEGIIKKHKPEVLVMEKLFFFKNLKTIIPVSQAGGVILLTSAKTKLPIFQFTPLQVKSIITGFGRAEKKDIQLKMQKIFKLKEMPKPDDAADALAIATAFCLRRERA